MYLSRLRLNPSDPAARRDLSDAYEMHRTLSRVFAADTTSSPARFLWRQEAGSNGWPDGTVLVQSDHAGRWEVLAGLDGYLQGLEPDKVVDLTTWIQPDRHYRFRIRANPTVTREGKRHGLMKEEDQLGWWTRQGERHGFEVLAAIRTGQEKLTARQRGARITVQSVQIEGHLNVRDAELVRNAVRTGLGHAKSLGLGLLSLASAN